MAFADAQSGGKILYGESPAPIMLAGTVSCGDALGFSGGWVRALATVAGVIQIRAVAGSDGVTGETITGYFGVTVVGGSRFSGATVNGGLYVAEGTASGQYTQTAPSTSGDATTGCGVMLSATVAAINPAHDADSHVA
jgi:hypothetical protein